MPPSSPPAPPHRTHQPRRRPRAQARRAAPTISLPEAVLRAERVAVLGVGSELRGDDIAGLLVARGVHAWCTRTGSRRLAAFDGGSAPENLTGEIARFRPQVVVLVDAAHLGRAPGHVEMVPRDRIGGVSFSTHMLPASIVLDYLEQTTGCETMLLGIEPAQKDVLAKPSREVAGAVRQVVKAFGDAFAERD
jgi:hydrogenase 3 maturation protease